MSHSFPPDPGPWRPRGVVPVVTRFAPSPTGELHLGHAFAALFAYAQARRAAGTFLLRIEDIDAGRCRAEHAEAILADLAWLGLDWPVPVRRQSDHLRDYAIALARLAELNLLYPCFCTRREIAEEIGRAGQAPHGPEGPVYPGTCRRLAAAERARRRERGEAHVLRLDVARAARRVGPLTWYDRDRGVIAARPDSFGDIVVARRDTPTSYHLAVTIDDHQQGVTLVTRGEDLFEATHVQRLLQALLDLDTPDYHHHPLLLDAAGRRLAKRDRALTLRALRQAGRTAAEVRRLACFAAAD